MKGDWTFSISVHLALDSERAVMAAVSDAIVTLKFCEMS